MEQLHDDEMRTGYFQQDGATAHCTRETIDFLREFFDDRLISRNTEIFWPARSCDLTPCDFFLWPHLKNSIFKTPVLDLVDLRQRIENKIVEINNNPLTLQNVIRGFRRRAILCIEKDGEHFQNFL
jgi:hypothetical protein